MTKGKNAIEVAKGKEGISIDETAILAGGARGGEYLDQIGITDLAVLSKEQWALFLTKCVTGALIVAIGNYQQSGAPF